MEYDSGERAGIARVRWVAWRRAGGGVVVRRDDRVEAGVPLEEETGHSLLAAQGALFDARGGRR